jgi:CubicO group peptidase (beta-lactamase class C family)
MKNIAIAVIAFSMGIAHLYGQSKNIALIDSLLTEMTRADSFSGVILIADSSGVLLSKGYGYSDRENKVKNTPDTRFDISTASNIFTGTAITSLAQQGKLKFTDTIGKYIKGLPKGNIITIHQVLTHSAGFDFFDNAKGFNYSKIKNCTDIMPFMRTLPLLYNPGDSCQYTSGNLIVLGAVIEKVTGMNFQDYIKKLFIQPLGLQNTGFVPYWSLDESQRQYAIGYTKTDSGYKRKAYNYDNGFIPLSAGGDWSSAADLYKFDKAVFSGKVVNEGYLKQMTARHTHPWDCCYFGYGWITSNKSNYSSIGHLGRSSAWHTVNEYYPKQQYTIIILTNFGSVDVDGLSQKFEGLLFTTK